jgi:ATP-dependent Clp protease adaptor protein ClpS
LSLPRWLLSSPADHEGDDGVITHSEDETQQELGEPPLYRVILHNDDYTPMQFVMLVLMDVFQFNLERAEAITYQVHLLGSGIVGIYPYEIAETKVAKATVMAQQQGYPLRLTLEEDKPI